MTFDGTLTWEEFLNCAKFILSVSDTIKDGWSLEGLKGKCKDGDLNKMKPGSLFLVKRNVMIANENNRNTNNSNGNDEILNDASGVDQKENGTMNENTDFRSDLLEEEENLMDISEETDISSSLTASTTSAFVSFEFHIVYSKSYNVPVMYLNASYLDGKKLTTLEIWSYMEQYYKDSVGGDRQSFLTQQEHPVLGRPFVFLHPCQTKTMMFNLFSEGATTTTSSSSSSSSSSTTTTPELKQEESKSSDSVEASAAQNKKFNYILAWLSTVGPFVRLSIPLVYHSTPYQ